MSALDRLEMVSGTPYRTTRHINTLKQNWKVQYRYKVKFNSMHKTKMYDTYNHEVRTIMFFPDCDWPFQPVLTSWSLSSMAVAPRSRRFWKKEVFTLHLLISCIIIDLSFIPVNDFTHESTSHLIKFFSLSTGYQFNHLFYMRNMNLLLSGCH